MLKEADHLRLLSIFHYVVGAIACLFACMPLIHTGLGFLFIFAPEHLNLNGSQSPPEFIGWLFFLMGLFFFLIGQIMALTIIISGRFIAKRKNYLFSFVIGCIVCAFFPFGTVLGVFTIIILSKESVKELYDTSEALV